MLTKKQNADRINLSMGMNRGFSLMNPKTNNCRVSKCTTFKKMSLLSKNFFSTATNTTYFFNTLIIDIK